MGVDLITRILFSAVLALATMVAPLPTAAAPQKGISLIRDAEAENDIRAMATPIWQAAGLDPSSVRIHLIKDDTLNAFVAGGLRLFLNTGLIARTDHPGQLIGVIAHETGHIQGGHLARLDEALRNATAEMILMTILAGAAAAGTGSGEAAMGAMLLPQHIAERILLSFSRGQESAADQAAVTLLDATHQSSKGLLEFFDILGDQELLVTARQDPYVRTHPLTRERVSFLTHHVEGSRYSNAAYPPEIVEMHRRVRAKLIAFIKAPSLTLQRYRADDRSLEARYARAIAFYRIPDLAQALPLIDGLIAERPRDPYFHELKGQMLFENQRPAEALAPYRKAVEYLPSSALLRINLAQVQIELAQRPKEPNAKALLKEAIANLDVAMREERDNGFAWNLMAVAYGAMGDEGMASLAMAEKALLKEKIPEAKFHAGRAEKLLRRGTPAWLQAVDVLERAAAVKDEKKYR